MAGIHVRFEITPESFLQDLIEASCRVAFRCKKRGVSEKKLRSSFKRALKAVLKKDMQHSEQCGSHVIGICKHALRSELWTEPKIPPSPPVEK